MATVPKRARLAERYHGLTVTGGGGSLLSAVSASHISFLGAYPLPNTIGSGQAYYSQGLALKYEPTDVGHEVHLITANYVAPPYSEFFEWRDSAAQNPGGDITNFTSYSAISLTGSKTYTNPFGTGITAKRRSITTYQGAGDGEIGAFQDGGQGLYWDEATSKLYVNYTQGYNSTLDAGNRDWSMTVVTLNYAASTATAKGPYKASSNGGKALGGGLTAIRPGFATTYLSGKRIGMGYGGYHSIVGTAEASLGPSFYAMGPIDTSSEETTHTTQTLIFHPSGSEFQRDDTYTYSPAASGGWVTGVSSQWGWNDLIQAGAYVYGATRAGYIAMASLGKGLNQYNSSHLAAEYGIHKWYFYSEAQLAATAANVSLAASQSPTATTWTYPTERSYPTSQNGPITAPYNIGSVSAITSSSGNTKDGYAGHAGDLSKAAVLTFTAPHGITSISDDIYGNPAAIDITINGCSSPTSYDGIWSTLVKSSTQLYIHNTSDPSSWSGTTATATGAVNRAGRLFPPAGAAFDPNTKILYVLRNHWNGALGNDCSFIEKYAVDC